MFLINEKIRKDKDKLVQNTEWYLTFGPKYKKNLPNLFLQ